MMRCPFSLPSAPPLLATSRPPWTRNPRCRPNKSVLDHNNSSWYSFVAKRGLRPKLICSPKHFDWPAIDWASLKCWGQSLWSMVVMEITRGWTRSALYRRPLTTSRHGQHVHCGPVHDDCPITSVIPGYQPSSQPFQINFQQMRADLIC